MSRLGHALLGLMFGMGVTLATIQCSGDSEWQCIRNADDSARYWISPDRMRLLIVNRASNDARYFDNTPGRLSFTYSATGIPGEWSPVLGYDGLFSVGSGVRIGVAFSHRNELPGSTEQPILERAAALLEQLYRTAFGPLAVTVTPYSLARYKAIRFDAIWEMTIEGQSAHVGATKILVEYNPEWVLQVTAGGTEIDSVVVDQIVDSFRTTEASDGLWPEVGSLLANIGGFSHVPGGARAR